MPCPAWHKAKQINKRWIHSRRGRTVFRDFCTNADPSLAIHSYSIFFGVGGGLFYKSKPSPQFHPYPSRGGGGRRDACCRARAERGGQIEETKQIMQESHLQTLPSFLPSLSLGKREMEGDEKKGPFFVAIAEVFLLLFLPDIISTRALSFESEGFTTARSQRERKHR